MDPRTGPTLEVALDPFFPSHPQLHQRRLTLPPSLRKLPRRREGAGGKGAGLLGRARHSGTAGPPAGAWRRGGLSQGVRQPFCGPGATPVAVGGAGLWAEGEGTGRGGRQEAGPGCRRVWNGLSAGQGPSWSPGRGRARDGGGGARQIAVGGAALPEGLGRPFRGSGAAPVAVGGAGLSAVGGARREKFREGAQPAQTGRGSWRRPRARRSGPAAMSSGDTGSGGQEGAARAAAALCGLYHEAGQRLRRLQDQLAARDALIERLRARLAALEGDAAPSLVDALLEQVARFREQLRQREGGAGEAALRQVRPRWARVSLAWLAAASEARESALGLRVCAALGSESLRVALRCWV